MQVVMFGQIKQKTSLFFYTLNKSQKTKKGEFHRPLSHLELFSKTAFVDETARKKLVIEVKNSRLSVCNGALRLA